MPKQKINVKEVVADIRSGMSDADLGDKYDLSDAAVQGMFKKLVDLGALGQQEIDSRSKFKDKSIEMAWRCPACDTPQKMEYEECPQCGIIVSKYLRQLDNIKQEVDNSAKRKL